MAERTPDWVHYGELLDQHFPAHAYSVDDRLNVLIFLLRTQGAMNIRRWKPSEKRSYEPLSRALRQGRVRALLDIGEKEEAWKVLRIILRGTGHRETKAQLDAYDTLRGEFDRLHSLPFRIGTRIGTADIRRRGYLLSDVRNGPRRALRPEDVRTFPELLIALHDHRVDRGNPAWRKMASNSERPCAGGRAEWHQSRSHTALREMLNPGSKPTLPAVLAFLRGCEGFSHEMEPVWAEAHAWAMRSVDRSADIPDGRLSEG